MPVQVTRGALAHVTRIPTLPLKRSASGIVRLDQSPPRDHLTNNSN